MPNKPPTKDRRPAKALPSVSRRSLMKTGLGASAGLLLPRISAPALAQTNYPALGTFPAGTSGSSVFVGAICPITGPYSASGKDMQLGFQLAIEHLNNGSRVTEQIPSLKKGSGVLGKKLEFQVADSETKPDTAVQAMTRFIRDNKAIMCTGGVASNESIAMMKLGQREHVIFMVGNSGSNDTTGKDCQRYGFRAQPSAYMAAKALAPVLAKELGTDRKAAYLVPDYTYGTSVYNSMKEFTEKVGWKTVNEQLAPLGTADFSSYLLNIANSGADVFVNVAFGADATASTKQAEQFGILSKMKYVVPNISQFQAKELGAAIMGGTYGTQAWWWTEEDKYPLAKFFVEDFRRRTTIEPRLGSERNLHSAPGLGRRGRARRHVLPDRSHQGAGERNQSELDLRRGLLPGRRSPDGSARSSDGWQEAQRNAGAKRLLSHCRSGAGRTGTAAARSNRLQDA